MRLTFVSLFYPRRRWTRRGGGGGKMTKVEEIVAAIKSLSDVEREQVAEALSRAGEATLKIGGQDVVVPVRHGETAASLAERIRLDGYAFFSVQAGRVLAGEDPVEAGDTLIVFPARQDGQEGPFDGRDIKVSLPQFSFFIFSEEIEEFTPIQKQLLNLFVHQPILPTRIFFHIANYLSHRLKVSSRTLYNHLKKPLLSYFIKYYLPPNHPDAYYIILPPAMHQIFKKYHISPLHFFSVISQLSTHFQNILTYRIKIPRYFALTQHGLKHYDKLTKNQLLLYFKVWRELVERVVL